MIYIYIISLYYTQIYIISIKYTQKKGTLGFFPKKIGSPTRPKNAWSIPKRTDDKGCDCIHLPNARASQISETAPEIQLIGASTDGLRHQTVDAGKVHPLEDWTHGSPTAPIKRKEHDLNQTSRELSSSR